MSAPENVDTRARLLTYARWAAIGLACIAALIIAAFSGAAALRIAAFMAVIAVVLVVLSITLNGASSTKLHLEETLLDEIDLLRDDVRADITTAARATHRALAEKVAHLHENIEHVRRQVDERALSDGRAMVQPAVSAPPPRRAIAGPPVPAVVHHTETVHVTTHQTYVDPVDDGRGAQFARPTTRRPEREEYVEPPRVDLGRADYGADRIRSREPHVIDETARHDRGGHDDRGGWADRPVAEAPVVGRPPAREESWAEARLRGFSAPRVPEGYDDSVERSSWRGRRDDEDPADDGRWSSMRSGDRWAEVRDDDHGRELRMGERRTAVRADETGTHMRVVDRWSSVRHDSPHYDGAYEEPSRGAHEQDAPFGTGADNTGETRRERRRREEAEEAGGHAEEDRRPGRRAAAADSEPGRWSAPERSRPALPASGPEPASGWMRGRGGDQREDRWDAPRGQREISGEIVRRPAQPEAAPRRSEHARSEPQRAGSDPRMADPRSAEPRSGGPRSSDRHAADPREHQRDAGPGRDGDYGRGAAPGRDAGYGTASRDAAGHGGHGTAGSDAGPGRDAGYPGRDSGYGPASRDAGPGRDAGYGAAGRDAGYGRDASPADGVGHGRDSRDGRSGRESRDDNRWEREPSGTRATVRPQGFDFDGTDDRWR